MENSLLCTTAIGLIHVNLKLLLYKQKYLVGGKFPIIFLCGEMSEAAKTHLIKAYKAYEPYVTSILVSMGLYMVALYKKYRKLHFLANISQHKFLAAPDHHWKQEVFFIPCLVFDV